MAGSLPGKSMTVAAYNSPVLARRAVELCCGLYGQRAMPLIWSWTSSKLLSYIRKGRNVVEISQHNSHSMTFKQIKRQRYMQKCDDTLRYSQIFEKIHECNISHVPHTIRALSTKSGAFWDVKSQNNLFRSLVIALNPPSFLRSSS